MKNSILLLLTLSLLTGCTSSWEGFVYPNGCLTCTEDYIMSPEFSSKRQCLNWAEDILDERNNPLDDYECGKNCEEIGYMLYSCDVTVK